MYDAIVIGAGAAGMMAAISGAREGKKVLLLEKQKSLGKKLKATGGGRCNLTNTLSSEEFMKSFGRDGKFMMDALKAFDHNDLIDFFSSIGVETHAPDGFRIFPVTHDSSTIINALKKELLRMGVEVRTNEAATKIEQDRDKITGVATEKEICQTSNIIIATGGLGYPQLGSDENGYRLAQDLHHKVTELFPAMTPLTCKEKWVANCRADTIAKAIIKVDLKKHKKLKATGDLIFTTNGIRGPVVLDFARELTPLLKEQGEVPILINTTKGMNEDQIFKHIKSQDPKLPVAGGLSTLIPKSLALAICKLSGADPSLPFNKLEGGVREKVIKNTAWTPLTLTSHQGFEKAMITRGGVSLKEIDPKTMESKIVRALYFCGEVVDLDGPCGGYNLQWSFSSGFLAGKLLR